MGRRLGHGFDKSGKRYGVTKWKMGDMSRRAFGWSRDILNHYSPVDEGLYRDLTDEILGDPMPQQSCIQ